jgi:two-component system, chemotaxis family, sensor kinase CheA
MSGDFDAEIIECFLDEAIDSLKEWEKACIDLEKQKGGQDNYDALFRCAHNLKGASRAVGLEAFGTAVHCIEDYIQELRKGELPTTPKSITLLLESQVLLEEWVNGLRDDSSFALDHSEIIEKFKELADHGEEHSECNDDNEPTIHLLEDTALKQSQPEPAHFTQVQHEPVDELEAAFLNAVQEYQNGTVLMSERNTQSLSVNTSQDTKEVKKTEQVDELESAFFEAVRQYQEEVNPHSDKGEKILADTPQVEHCTKIEEIPSSEIKKAINAPEKSVDADITEKKIEKTSTQEPASSAQKEQKADASKNQKKGDETIRVAAHKLDELIQLVGELSIHQSIVMQGRRNNNLGTKMCQNAIILATKITKDLQASALSLRMQPVEGMFQRLERVARDVARNQGKQIEIIVDGTEVELDRTVIEKMTDPLIHVVRNAVDHGIETSEERKQTAKSQYAQVILQAVQDASGVVIRIIDDGRGLNADKVFKKAVEKGLVKADEKLTQQQIYNLIFLPGFSTAEKLTDISGRGVGMDVVLKAVQGLRGTVDVNSELGKGSIFNITLPTSLSIMDALIVKINESRYAVPMHQLTEIIDTTNFSIETSGNKGKMIDLRGEVVPIETLHGYLKSKVTDKNSFKKGNIDDKLPALIVKENDKYVAFQVDTILGQQQVVIRPLSKQMSKLPGFSGCTILGDGEPSIILSLPDIAKIFLKQFKLQEARA